MASETQTRLWIYLGHFLNHIGNYLTPALLIYLQTDIPLTQTERGLLGSIPMILLVCLSSIVGTLGDKKHFWRKHLIWFGLIGIGVSGILMTLATSFIDLALATVILGFGLSTYHPLAFYYLNSMPQRDKNMGIFAVAGNIGTAITPLIAMLLSIFSGWRFSFLTFAIIMILAGLTFVLLFPNDQEFNTDFDKFNEEEQQKSEVFSRSQMITLVFLVVLISATRAPVFRSISYFTSVVFVDGFNFSNIESSILTAIVLGIGAFAALLGGLVNNRKAERGAKRDERVIFRTNTLLISNGGSTLLLIFLVFLPYGITILLIYLLLAFIFFFGAAILPTIISEIVSSKQMGTSFGVFFSGATLAGAIAPTIFGMLADSAGGFSLSFAFLDIIVFACLLLIILFRVQYQRVTKKIKHQESKKT
ncbi:MAG: nitrate/nitrite transporter [Promethearchaeota archaeon]